MKTALRLILFATIGILIGAASSWLLLNGYTVFKLSDWYKSVCYPVQIIACGLGGALVAYAVSRDK